MTTGQPLNALRSVARGFSILEKAPIVFETVSICWIPRRARDVVARVHVRNYQRMFFETILPRLLLCCELSLKARTQHSLIYTQTRHNEGPFFYTLHRLSNAHTLLEYQLLNESPHGQRAPRRQTSTSFSNIHRACPEPSKIVGRHCRRRFQ